MSPWCRWFERGLSGGAASKRPQAVWCGGLRRRATPGSRAKAAWWDLTCRAFPGGSACAIRSYRLSDPSKTISDQYAAIQILKKNGEVVTGRVANLSGTGLQIVTDMFAPGTMTGVAAVRTSTRCGRRPPR